MRALHVICSLVLSVHAERMAFAQTEESAPVPAPAGKSAEQEPTQPNVTLKPARERGEGGAIPQDNPTMALTPEGQGNDKKPAGKSAEQVKVTKQQSAEWLKTCLEDWDAQTHMSKAEWRTTCKRVSKEREQFLLETPGATSIGTKAAR